MYQGSTLKELSLDIFDLIKCIRDPERVESLEELSVISEDSVTVQLLHEDTLIITVTFIPTVPHCSLAAVIGLTIRQKLQRDFLHPFKLDVFVQEGSHNIEEDVNKQINDKERVAAAMENPNLVKLVRECIDDGQGVYR